MKFKKNHLIWFSLPCGRPPKT